MSMHTTSRINLLPTLIVGLLLLGLCHPVSGRAQNLTVSDFPVLYVELEATINPAQVDLLDTALDVCLEKNCRMLLLRLDTPGGLGESMREMVKTMLNAPVPVAVWVGPAGARAASAGVFLVAASSVAGMSPQSTMGAASPVSLSGGDVNGTMATKVKNDMLSLIRGVVQARGRNVDWYVKAVEESVSVTAQEALELGVIEYVTATPLTFLESAGTDGLAWRGDIVTFSPDALRLVTYEPPLWHDLLSWLLNPQIAYLLLLGGIAGIFFELTNPGAIFPGVFGGICLLLGLYSLAVLPTNAGGLLLILFGLVLFALEIKVTSYGLLSIGGIVCLFIGSLILFRFDYGMTRLPLSTVIATVATVSLFVVGALVLVARAQLREPWSGKEAMIGLKGEVRHWNGSSGQIFVRGETWSARSATRHDLAPGDKVRIAGLEGLVCIVEPQPGENT